MKTLPAIAATLLLLTPAAANAHTRTYRGALLGHTNTQTTHRHHTRRARRPALATVSTGIPVGVGGGLSDCGQTPEPDMQTVRVILYWDEPIPTFYQCAQQATRAGDRVIVSVQFNPAWSVQQDQAWFQAAISLYGPLNLYAMSVGNEEDLYGITPARYVAVWQAVEPMIAAQLPNTLRVAGEISPWGLRWFELTAQIGLPGVQVFAGHPYPDGGRGFDPAALAGLGRLFRVPAWATEGMCGPNAWPQYGCVARGELQQDGIALGVDWYVSSSTPGVPAAPGQTE